MYMERRTKLQDIRNELEMQTFNLFPERWRHVYLGINPSVEEEDEEGEVVNNVEDLDAYFDNLEASRSASGADVEYAESSRFV